MKGYINNKLREWGKQSDKKYSDNLKGGKWEKKDPRVSETNKN